MQEKKMPKKPCIGCVYFTACGSTTRTMPCNGRETETDRAKAAKKDRR